MAKNNCFILRDSFKAADKNSIRGAGKLALWWTKNRNAARQEYKNVIINDERILIPKLNRAKIASYFQKRSPEKKNSRHEDFVGDLKTYLVGSISVRKRSVSKQKQCCSKRLYFFFVF